VVHLHFTVVFAQN